MKKARYLSHMALIPQIRACAESGLGKGDYRSYARAMISLAKRAIGQYQLAVASGACPPPASVECVRRGSLEQIVIFKVTVEECAARARTPIELGFELWKVGLGR